MTSPSFSQQFSQIASSLCPDKEDNGIQNCPPLQTQLLASDLLVLLHKTSMKQDLLFDRNPVILYPSFLSGIPHQLLILSVSKISIALFFSS